MEIWFEQCTLVTEIGVEVMMFSNLFGVIISCSWFLIPAVIDPFTFLFWIMLLKAIIFLFVCLEGKYCFVLYVRNYPHEIGLQCFHMIFEHAKFTVNSLLCCFGFTFKNFEVARVHVNHNIFLAIVTLCSCTLNHLRLNGVL